MSKRRAGNELTRDNWDNEEEQVEAGKFQVANESIMKNRIVKRAKRMLQRDESGEIKPIFSGFSGFNNITNNSNTKQAFSFLSKCSETPSENGNHPSASTINSMTTSTSLAIPENSCAKSSGQTIVNPDKVMKLNEAFVKFITDAVQKNPYCVLTPTLKDYEKQVNKFVTISGSKTNTFDSSMASSKESPQVSSYENTKIHIKDMDEVKNNSVNIKTDSTSFTSPDSNMSNNSILFKFGSGNTINNVDTSKNISKFKELDDKGEEKEKAEPTSELISVGDSKDESIATGGFKLGDFKINQQSFSTSLSNKSSESVFNDQKISPFKTPEIKFNATPFSFEKSVPTFSFKPMEQQTNKPFFSFGSKLPVSTPSSNTHKDTEVQKSKDEEDEDQPPVVNFTPIKENDAIFESKSKLYCLKNGKYEELGIGQLYLKQVDDRKIQLIMRNDSALGTIMVNTLLNESINFTKRNAKTVQLICVLDPTKSTKPQTVLFKFKDSQITESFEKELLHLKK